MHSWKKWETEAHEDGAKVADELGRVQATHANYVTTPGSILRKRKVGCPEFVGRFFEGLKITTRTA